VEGDVRTVSKHASITLVAGKEQRTVRGRMAVIYGELAAFEQDVNAGDVGRLTVHYAHGQLKVEHTRSREGIRFDDELE
jgi:hypothetical protein